MLQDSVDSYEMITSNRMTAFFLWLVVNKPHTLRRRVETHGVVEAEAQMADLRHIDKLFLLVSMLYVAHDSVFKETAQKRSVCLLLSWSPI